MLRTLAAGLSALVLVPAASAQTIVTTGDDLVAVVAAAVTGDVIQIHSDATFHGTLVPTGKTITIEAAAGFAPTIKGSFADNCVRVIPHTAGAGVTLRGLRLEGGDSAVGPGVGPSVVLQSWGSTLYSGSIVVEDCTIEGNVAIFGDHDADCSLTLMDSVLEDNLVVTGTNTIPADVDVVGCEVQGAVTATSTIFLGTPRLADVELVRSRFLGEVSLNASSGGSLAVTMDSCIVDRSGYPGPDFGIRVYADTTGTVTNTTVTGAKWALQGQPGVSWHNMLLTDNEIDVTNIAPTEIEHSLIEDGSFDGVNGNLAGPAMLDTNLALLFCSPGVDAGTNTAPGLGDKDFHGDPRVQDNDGDLTATVSVGAIESTGSAPGNVALYNGTDVNPVAYSAIAAPMVGVTFGAHVMPSPGTVLTVVVIDTPAGPFTGPGWTGELLLALSGTAMYSFGLGPHGLPVPLDCALVGVTVHSQAFRVDDVLGEVSLNCVNGLALTIGA